MNEDLNHIRKASSKKISKSIINARAKFKIVHDPKIHSEMDCEIKLSFMIT